MSRKSLIISTIVFVFFFSLYSCNSDVSKNKVLNGAGEMNDSLIKRGGYLVSIVGCVECHSPKIMTVQGLEIDSTKILSGYSSSDHIVVPHLKDFHVIANDELTAFYGPWGATFAANITSDATGIGNWSETEFRNAIINGKHLGIDKERNVLPPMQSFKDMKDYDIKAIFTYLKSTKPVRNIVPDWIPPGKK